MAMFQSESLINERIGWVDDELRSLLAEEARAGVGEMLRYHMGWTDAEGGALDAGEARRLGGKRLRGVLVILACEACGGSGYAAVPAGAAVELLHNFTLIHDDIEDCDELRRHRPTVWRLWGVPQATNAGSQMQALVDRAALRLLGRGVSAEVTAAVIGVLSKAILEVTTGQYQDMAFQNRADVGVEEYFDMAAGKTAALLSAALDAGARIAGVGEDRIERLLAFGHSFGLAFQARDDYLGIWGDPATTGKPVGSDVRQGKRSLPVVLALSRATGRSDLREWLEANDVEAVMAAMERLGVRSDVEAIVERLTAEAVEHLEALGEGGTAGEALSSIARTALGRDR